ncbi:MAG TPA: PDZ domain-containing protein [Thermoanaerobaculia bacterium]|nr:PDZ domain-containing protein [Thermoanaerobaculia bacterium]
MNQVPRFRAAARAASILLLLALTAAPVLSGADKQLCNLPADECAKQIRDILSGGKYLGLKLEQTRRGLVVTRVVPDSAADRAGLRANDRIISVNGTDCTSATIRSFKEIMKKLENSRRITFTIDRSGFFRMIVARYDSLTREQIEKIVATHLEKAHSGESPRK